MHSRRHLDKALEFVVWQLRFDLPSRKEPALDILRKSLPYVSAGFILWGISLFFVPGALLFPRIWIISLGSFRSWFQFAVYFSLSAVMVWSFLHSVGLLVVITIRGASRRWLEATIKNRPHNHPSKVFHSSFEC